MNRKVRKLITGSAQQQINTANIIQRLRRYRVEVYHLAQTLDAVLDRMESGEQEPPSG